jgi:hypothetical protein
MMMKSGKPGTSRHWNTIGQVVRGAIHVRQDKPCQDALHLKTASGSAGHYAIACVADGHGSDRCPHSDEGAQAAVLTASSLLASILDGPAPSGDAFSILSAHKDIWLPKQLETQWKSAVKTIHEERERPLINEEPFPYELYGTTLLALAATESFIFAMQIGDGDILMVDREAINREPTDVEAADYEPRWVFPPNFAAGEDTYSLCMEQAWQYVRTIILPWDSAQGPQMFLLSTDGYANSFTSTSGFLKAGADIYKLLRENGMSYVEENLANWLTQSSVDGSGDDIAMALIVSGS